MAIRWTDATPAMQLPNLPHASARQQDAPVDVWIAAAVDERVMAHLRARDVEQGGLLIGRAFANAETAALAHVQVLKCAPADDAHGTAFSLRMGTAVWQAAQSLVLPGEMIVGWYHSHPGLSAFFSDTDRQTQRAFFNNPYSVGWVVDPVTREEALFLGADCTPVQRGPDRTQLP
jgi:proteasome lid subunit RPN8/RPN11